MPAYTPQNVNELLLKIRAKVGPYISAAAKQEGVPEWVIAGLVGVECTKFDPLAVRFEPKVFAALGAVKAGLRKAYGAVTREKLASSTDSLKDLATSHGYTQIMGYHALLLGRPVSALKGPATHFEICAQMLKRDAGKFLARDDTAGIESIYRIWNTGRPDGTTYDPDYAQNARKVADAYRMLLIGGRNG